MGPAFAAPVAPKAIADRAITEAIAVIEIIFMLNFPLTWMPTLNMEIGDRRGDYKESNLGSSIRIGADCVSTCASGSTASIALKGEFSGTIEIVSYLQVKGAQRSTRRKKP